MSNKRFIDKNFLELQQANRNPIFGYEELPLLTLEESVQELISLIPDVKKYAIIATQKCNQHSSLLTRDESAAIYLCTMQSISFFESFNKALRTSERNKLKPWLAFLKLFITALRKLPSIRTTVWRGVCGNVSSAFDTDDIHIWWNVTSCTISTDVAAAFVGDDGTLIAIETIHGKDISAFSACPDEQEIILMPGTRVRRKAIPLEHKGLFVLHLEEIYSHDQIRQEYIRNNRLHRLLNPSQSFPIDQCYINLVIVNRKDQLEKEKQMNNIQHGDAIMGTYEEIYGVKTAIDVEDIFKSCKNEKKQVLVFGRAGIGKSTFCRYLACQWARGSFFSEYELVALIPLRHLTIYRYPANKMYSLADVVETEVFSVELSKTESDTFKRLFDAKKTLWILDGYDEIKGNIPPHLEYLFENLLKTPHHILTSRPYLNTLSYAVQMEITGFTNENITQYIHQFFEQIEEKSEDDVFKRNTLLQFLKLKQSIWDIAHIPVNLELICSVWYSQDLSEIRYLTITSLYTTITEWLCRRYLMPQNIDIQMLSEEEIHEHCQKELTFLENLAFNAMDANTIVIRPSLLKTVLEQTKIKSHDYTQILRIGLLKSFHKQPIDVQVELKKDHYFIHLSFQEYFAARYLIRALTESKSEEAKEFINRQKYNQRYTLVFNFMSGLISETHSLPTRQIFWNIILEEPLDMVGIRHMQLVISCMDAASDITTIPNHSALLKWIADCIQQYILQPSEIISNQILQHLTKAESVINNEIIVQTLIRLLQDNDTSTKAQTLVVLRHLNISNQFDRIHSLVTNSLSHQHQRVRKCACEVISNMGEKAATCEVINRLVSALEDQNEKVRQNACEALGNMGEKAATNEVVNKLVSALGDQNEKVRQNACEALGKMGEKAATNEVINKLVSALEDQNYMIRRSACEALDKIGEKIDTEEIILPLLHVVKSDTQNVSKSACETLCRTNENVAAKNVIDKLVALIKHDKNYVSENAKEILSNVIGSPGTLSLIDPSIILDLMSKYKLNVLKNISIVELIRLFIETKHRNWLTVIIHLLYSKPIAVVFDANELFLYDRKEPINLVVPDRQLVKQLCNAIVSEAKKFHIYWGNSLGFEPISNSSSFASVKNENDIFTFEPNNMNEANFDSQFSENSKLMLTIKSENMYQNFVLLYCGVESPMKYCISGHIEMKKCDDREKCITSVLKITNKMIYLIVSMDNYRSIIPLVHKHYCVERIYLYGSNDITSISTWLSKYEKVDHSYSDMEKLYNQVDYDIKKVIEKSVHWKTHTHTSCYTMLHTQQFQYRESIISVAQNTPSDECIIILRSEGSDKEFQIEDLLIPIHKCETAEKCLEMINNQIQSKIFLIISEYSDLSNIQNIFNYSSMHAIYFLGEYDIKCLSDKNKVAGFFENSDQLSNQLKQDIQFYREHRTHTTEINILSPMKPKQGIILPLDNQNSRFLVYNFFADILGEIPLLDFNDEDLSNICKKLYPNNESEITRYINQLCEDDGITNFALDPRFSQIITNIHQSDELNAVLVFQKILVNIQKCATELANLLKLESVYLVKIVSENTLEKLKAAKGCYITLGFFILATKSLLVARDIARVMANNNLITILFQIQIDIGTRIFELQPNHIVFPLSPLFSFESMSDIAADGVYYARIKSIYPELKSIKEQFQCEMYESLSWLSYGNYVCTLNESKKAKNYYDLLIEKLPSCHKDKQSINDRLEDISRFKHNDNEYEQFDDLHDESLDYLIIQ